MRLLAALALSLTTTAATADPLPFLTDKEVSALATEISGETAKRSVEGFSRHHRMRGSRGYRAAADQIVAELRRYGLNDAHVESLPADGKIFYGTQRSRPAWNAELAELWELDADGARVKRLASWEATPIALAQDSWSGEANTALVDVGDGLQAEDYRDVAGKLVLTSSQPGQIASLAIGRFKAAGILSYAQNQRTAWYGEDETLVRWGHLETFAPESERTFAFMLSLQAARALQGRLARGETVRLHAVVRAGQEPGSYDLAMATIRGSELPDEEIVYSCHLDHPRPGANDNASGCAAILEVARTLSKLVAEKRIAPPRRTIRFVWPPEIEGTIALLNARPDLAGRARAVIHMDMVGGDAEITKAVFRVTRSPKSLPTFVNDVAEAFGRFANAQSDLYASTRSAPYPLVDPEGGKRALQADFVDFTEGSDHQVWTEGSWRVPAIYLNDWPDRYIHTHHDSIANIDATKLLRAAFLGAAGAYYLADLGADDVPALWQVVRRHALERGADLLARQERLRAAGQAGEIANLSRFHLAYEQAVLDSIAPFAEVPAAVRQDAGRLLASLRTLAGDPPAPGRASGTVYRRNAELKGPMEGFGYEYLEDKMTGLGITGPARPALLGYEGLWGASYPYEALNLVDGRRTVGEIRDALAAIYGPVPLEQVSGFLEVLERAGVLRR